MDNVDPIIQKALSPFIAPKCEMDCSRLCCLGGGHIYFDGEFRGHMFGICPACGRRYRVEIPSGDRKEIG